MDLNRANSKRAVEEAEGSEDYFLFGCAATMSLRCWGKSESPNTQNTLALCLTVAAKATGSDEQQAALSL